MIYPTVSVIIPCYNAEKYIEKAMQSLLNQSYTQWECIVIDDGSSDTSNEIIRRNSTPKFTLITQENKGLSASRNIGLKKAKGEYILFFDADDFLPQDAISNLIAPLQNKKKAEVILGNTLITKGQNGKIIGEFTSVFEDSFLQNENFNVVKKFLTKNTSSVAWNKLFSKNFLIKNKLFFLKGIYHEDELFFFEILLKSKNLISVNKFTYKYATLIENSITNTTSLKSIDSYITILNYIHKNYLNNPSYKNLKSLISLYILHFRGILITLFQELSKEEKTTAALKIKENFKNNPIIKTKKVLKRKVEVRYLKILVLNYMPLNIASKYLTDRNNNIITKIFYNILVTIFFVKNIVKIRNQFK